MSSSYTVTESITFTIIHAQHMAAKVATDLKRMQRFHGFPNDDLIENFQTEIVELLRAGYLADVTYGFKRDGKWIEPTLKYTAQDLMGLSSSDDDPGRVSPSADTTGAAFYSFLNHNSAWWRLTDKERETINNKIPLARSNAVEPGINGYFTSDRTYSAGGRALNRSSVRSL